MAKPSSTTTARPRESAAAVRERRARMSRSRPPRWPAPERPRPREPRRLVLFLPVEGVRSYLDVRG